MKTKIYILFAVVACMIIFANVSLANTILKTEIDFPHDAPIKILEFNSSQPNKSHEWWVIKVKLKNISEKKIIAMDLLFQQYNAFDERLQYEKHEVQISDLMPGNTYTYTWKTSSYSLDAKKVIAKAVRGRFVDGTLWPEKKQIKRTPATQTGTFNAAEYEEVQYEKVINDIFAPDFLNKKVKFTCKFLTVLPKNIHYSALNNLPDFPRDLIFFSSTSDRTTEKTFYLSQYYGAAMSKNTSQPLFQLNPLDKIKVFGTVLQFTHNPQMKYNIITVHAIEKLE